MRYSLQNKNIRLIDFDIDTSVNVINGISSYNSVYSITKIHEDFRSIFPKDLFEINNSTLKYWLDHRKAPKNRQFINQILSSFENSQNPITFLDVTHGLSLNDTFWINCLDAPLSWEDCNLYQHDFNEIIAYIAFTGYSSKRISGVFNSPEFTTGGAQKKCWSKREDGVFLIKGASPLYDLPERKGRTDVVSEYCASQLASALGLDHVDYDLELFKHYDGHEELVCKCKLFTSENEGYLPFYVYASLNHLSVNDSDVNDYSLELQYADLYGKKAFEDMMVFDSLILNTDRHMNNYGMIFDTDTGEILRPAPLFDHGNSLLVGAAKSDFQDPSDYISTLRSQFGLSFDEQAYRFIQSRHVSMLKQLENFHFERHLLLSSSESYFSFLERFIHERAAHLIELKNLRDKSIKKNKAKSRNSEQNFLL